MPPAPPGERVFLDERGVLVTSARFVAEGRTFALPAIAAVRAEVIPPHTAGASACFALAALAAFVAIFAAVDDSHLGAGWLAALTAAGCSAGAVALAALGVWERRRARPMHALMLSTPAGEARALSHDDGEFVDRVVAALSDAIVWRG